MMVYIWEAMGFMRYPLSFAMLMVVGLTFFSTYRLYRPGAGPDLRTKAWVDAILFWGGFATIAGVLGTVVGITIAAQAIEAAGDVSTALVWGGIKVAMLTSAFGLLIMAASSLLWFGLQLRWRFLEAAEREDDD